MSSHLTVYLDVFKILIYFPEYNRYFLNLRMGIESQN